jgi:sulfate adenylyltransferase
MSKKSQKKGSAVRTETAVKSLLINQEDRDQLLSKHAATRRLTLTDRQRYDLEMLISGGFSPLQGFMTEEEYRSVVDTMHLPDGSLWPMPIVLDIDESREAVPAMGDDLILCDNFGNPLALMRVESIYKPQKEDEAERVFGTTDETHFGVGQLFHATGATYLGGPVTGITLPAYPDFIDMRHTPASLRELFKSRGWEKVVGFQTRNPMHRAHFEIVKRAAEEIGAKALIHPVVGMTKTGDIDYVTRVHSYKRVQESYAKEFAEVSLLPLAMRMGGPREALWHAIIRRNYGCTHFIVGRDHAGPGKDRQGKPFYEPYAAQDAVKEHEEELGITMVTPKEMVYVEERATYVPINEVAKTETIKNISGTEFREMLRRGDPIPSWFSFPEVVSEIRRLSVRDSSRGFVIFFTGLSGAGKSTVAERLHVLIRERAGREVTFLDGDVIRLNLSKGLGFSKEDRNTNIERIGFVAAEVARHGGIVIASAIAPYEAPRRANRERVSEVGTYIEVHVATPIAVCKKRDAKGLYAKAEKGEIKGFTGVDDPYEEPSAPEIVMDTSTKDPDMCALEIYGYLVNEGLLK